MNRWKPIWISDLICEPSIRVKILMKHGLTNKYLRSEFVAATELLSRSEHHPYYGLRQIVFTPKQKLPRVVLIIDSIDKNMDIWNIQTAFRTSNPALVGR